jgi:hypothetical protein
MSRELSHVQIPPGSPAWVTAELIQQTIIVWQPYYANPLTIEDAVDIMQAAGRLLKALACEDQCHETVCRTRSGQQS